VPDDIYDLALQSTSPQVVLAAIQSMLAAGHPESFAALQRAIESDCESLRTSASELVDALFSRE
jgi:HEAT repeat protein